MTDDRERGLLKAYVDTSALQASLGAEEAGAKLSGDQTQILLLAEAHEQGYVDFVTNAEARMNLPAGDNDLLFGAPIAPAATPDAYIQALEQINGSDHDSTYAVLQRLEAPRYRDLLQIFGGREASRADHLNAFDLWCAEVSECDVLLTVDRDFQTRALQAEGETVPVAGPGEVLEGIGNRIGRWRTFRFLLKGRKRIGRERASR